MRMERCCLIVVGMDAPGAPWAATSPAVAPQAAAAEAQELEAGARAELGHGR